MPISGKPSTHVKSFFADSVQSAIETAQLEMGPDALLLDSREAPPEARHLGDFEVVFGACVDPLSAPAPAPSSEVEQLRREMEEIRQALRRLTPSEAAQVNHAEEVAKALADTGVDPDLARQIGESARQKLARRSVPTIGSARPAGGDVLNPMTAAAEEVSAAFEVAPEIGHVTALVGPPGCGKTTTIIKLAIRHGLAQGRPVHLISTDTQRIGGADQLRTYAAILGVHFQAVESPAALALAIEAAPANGLVLIDTPGYSAVMLQDLGGDMARFLSRRQDIDTHLVLTASMRIEDLYNTAALYEAFGPAKLLFTRVDETSSLAAVFCVAARRSKPVSFLCHGQSVPEDIAPATKEKIVSSLVRQLPSVVEAVA